LDFVPFGEIAQRKKTANLRALSDTECDTVVETLNSERFQDLAPREVYATLLGESKYHCSVRTMYRILKARKQSRERRPQAQHPKYSCPELLATRPNELWSWDITRLKGPSKCTYFNLYVIIDVFSRYVVGWMLAYKESAVLAQRLIAETCAKHHIQPGQLTLHADRGSSMKSKPVAFLLADLGVIKTHSRPHVSNDNPYSESHFKTLKYRPEFPDRFGCIEDARAFCQTFFQWYNVEHHHSGISSFTPEAVHYGRTEAIAAIRNKTLNAAFQAHPERFVKGQPKSAELPSAVWINKPKAGATH